MARKVLIVDDDPDALRLVSYAFQAEGYEVATAASGSEALARLGSERPDLVVLDVMMPDMSGLEVCQRIRNNRAIARLPILMLSARGQVADRISGLKAGADDYLPKPADTGELIARAEALLSRATATGTPPTAVTIAFMGCKGGSGTTTVAVNVATCLATAGKSVCLVELQCGASTASLLLKLRPLVDLSALLAKDAAELSWQDIQGRLIPHASGLRLLAAPQNAEGNIEIHENFVEALLSHLGQGNDYVLLDLPASWSAANRTAVRLARFTAVTCEPDPPGIHCAKATLAALRQWGIMGDLVGLVVVNRSPGATPMALPAIRNETGTNVVGAIPPAAEPCAAAARDGVPLVTLMPQHMATVALKELASRLTAERIKPMQ